MGFWHEWRGSSSGRQVMLIRTLLNLRGYRVDLHKFIGADEPGCFHTHPATAIRVILLGGYFEEIRDGAFRAWLPGEVGIIKPELCHRVHALRNDRYSYSLWIRFPKRAEITIYGDC